MCAVEHSHDHEGALSVGVDSVCRKVSAIAFLPATLRIYSLEPAPLQRPLSQRLAKLVYLIQLYTVILPLCLFLCNNPASLFSRMQ